MNKTIQVKLMVGTLLFALVAMVVSCARTSFIPLTPGGATPTATTTIHPVLVTFTPTNTAGLTPSTTPGNSLIWDDFDEVPWTSWTNAGAQAYLVSVYMQLGTFNHGTVVAGQNGSVGALDLNATFTGTTGNLIEATIDSGTQYGGSVDETTGGRNPSALSLWVKPSAAMLTSRVFVNVNGVNYSILNSTSCPANVWTNVYVNLSSISVLMSTVRAVIIDMTCSTTGTVDVLYDNICFYPSGSLTPVTSTPTQTSTPTATNTVVHTPATPTNTSTTTTGVAPTATPGTNIIFDDFDEVPWTGWTNNGPESYQVSAYVQNCTFNDGSQSTTAQSGVGSLDMNMTFTSATSNLFEATIESNYGANVDTTVGGHNPIAVSFWVRPSKAMSVSKVWITVNGTNYSFLNATLCPANVWTDVYVDVSTIPVSMTVTRAVIVDMTCPTTGNVDILFDTIAFYPYGSATPIATALTPSPTFTHTLSPTFTYTGTPTDTPTTGATFTPTVSPTATPNGAIPFVNFDTPFWTGWTDSGGNGYTVSVYTQNAVFYGGTQNTTVTQSGAGSLDINADFTAATGNLLETTVEYDYGSKVDATTGGVNPSGLSFWVNPTLDMTMQKVWVSAPTGTNTPYTNNTFLRAGTWTNVYQSLSGQPTSMAAVEAIIVDMTCNRVGMVDVRYDTFNFYP